MALGFSISPASDVPIYRQITRQVRAAIAQGRLRLGEQLPAIRTLAEELVINPNTVARAYQDLVREGFAETRAGIGLFVCERQPALTREERTRRLGQAVEDLFHDALALDCSLAEVQALLEKKWRELPARPDDPERKRK
jgi:DNA-binding transcriptional regulator YhcF (GntR family)